MGGVRPVRVRVHLPSTAGFEFHLNHQTLVAHKPEFDCGRMVLTHLGSEMSARRGQCDFETADDGLHGPASEGLRRLARPGTISPSTAARAAPVQRGRWFGRPSSALRPSSANAIASHARAGTPAASIGSTRAGARARASAAMNDRILGTAAAHEETRQRAGRRQEIPAGAPDRLDAEGDQRRHQIVLGAARRRDSRTRASASASP